MPTHAGRREPAAALRRRSRPVRTISTSAPPALDLKPASVYEAVTRQKVEALAEDIKEIKGRLNGLLWMVASAILLDLVLRLTGAT